MTRLFISNAIQDEMIIINQAADINYLVKVMRKKIGDEIFIFNPQNGEFLAQIINITKKEIVLKIIKQTRTPVVERTIRLIFAPIKHPRIHFLIEKATELGVTHLIPIRTKHSVVDKMNMDKWNIYVKEAAEQCERLSFPEISPLVDLDKFLNNWDQTQEIIFCNEKEQNFHISKLEINSANAINILIGPEGGFSLEEISLLSSKKFIKSVSLGKNTLRAETAALAALAICSL